MSWVACSAVVTVSRPSAFALRSCAVPGAVCSARAGGAAYALLGSLLILLHVMQYQPRGPGPVRLQVYSLMVTPGQHANPLRRLWHELADRGEGLRSHWCARPIPFLVLKP